MGISKYKGYLFVVVVGLIWGIEPVLFKALSYEVSFYFQNFFRFLTTSLFLTLFLKIRGTGIDREKTKFSWKTILVSSIVFFIYSVLLMKGIALSKSNLATFVINCVGPVVSILILSIFIKEERVHLKQRPVQAALAMGVVAAAFIMKKEQTGSYELDNGLLLILLADGVWAAYIICLYNFSREGEEILWGRNVTAVNSVFFFLAILWKNELPVLLGLSGSMVIKLMMLGIVVDVLTVILYYPALRMISATRANTILLSAPIFTIFLSGILLHEGFTSSQMIGCGISFASSILMVASQYNSK